MKNSIKIAAVLSIALLAGTMGAKAQTSAPSTSSDHITYSIGLETSLSVGKFNHEHKGSLGGSLAVDIPLSQQFSFNATTGYNNFYGRDIDGFEPRGLRIIPVMAGAKFFPVSNFYLQADAGAAFLTNKNDLDYDKSSAFLYAPGVGVQIPVGGSSSIDASVRYEGSTRFGTDSPGSKISVIGLRVAYAFGL